MALIRWSAHFATGIAIIDTQHSQLIDLINDSAPVLALSYASNPERAGELLSALADYARYHFATEDKLMTDYAIDAAQHQRHGQAHDAFIAAVGDMIARYQQGEELTGSSLLAFLTNWLVFHILGEDQAMARQIHAINAGQRSPVGHLPPDNDPQQAVLTQALVDLYAQMTEQNRELQELNDELLEHREHLADLVHQRTAELEIARDAAEAANRAKSRFIANLSHEIRTPMNSIVSLNWLLQEQIVDPEARAKLQQMSQATQQLLGVINDLLDISRIESEQLRLEALDFSPLQLMRQLHAAHREPARQRGLSIELDLPAALPELVHGDPVRIAQIVGNFISNALKFTECGSIQLSLSLAADAPAGQAGLQFSVRDSGSGIAPAIMARIFEPFAQGDDSSRRRHGGTGLGLAICQRLSAMMNGEIAVSSTLGTGSTFRFVVCLPIVAAEPSRPRPLPEAAAYPVPTTASHGPAIDEALARLENLLAEDDIAAFSLWRELAEQLHPALGAEASQIEKEIRRYAFDKALLLTRAARQRRLG